MSEFLLYGLTALLIFGAVGGVGLAFAGGMNAKTQKRVATVAKVQTGGRLAAVLRGRMSRIFSRKSRSSRSKARSGRHCAAG
jgi:hypothetical protein